MLKLMGRRSSFNVQKVVWLLEELGCPYSHTEMGGQFGGLDQPEFLALNPHGRVPVLLDGELAVWESHSILRYLAAQFDTGSYWNPVPRDRARVDQWVDWAQTELQPDFLGGVFWGYYRTPAPQRDEAAVARSVEACARHFHLIEDLLGCGEFLMGDSPTLADIVIGTHLFRYYGLDIERPALPRLEAYFGRLQRRPGYRKGVMVPFGDLFGRLDF